MLSCQPPPPRRGSTVRWKAIPAIDSILAHNTPNTTAQAPSLRSIHHRPTELNGPPVQNGAQDPAHHHCAPHRSKRANIYKSHRVAQRSKNGISSSGPLPTPSPAPPTPSQHHPLTMHTSQLGRLAHFTFDAVLLSAFLAGVKRSTGLT